jgi:HEAT repeat protein
MGSPRVVPELVAALGDRSRDVRAAAARSLGRLASPEAIEPLVTAGVEQRVPREVTCLALFDIGPVAVPRLLELTAHPEPAVRTAAAELVGFLGDAGDAGALRSLLADTAAPVRAAAAAALGRLGASAARDALVELLDDRVPTVRGAAATALGRLGGRRALDALLRVARTDDFEPASAAAEAAARIDPDAVAEAAERGDAGPHLREAADRVAV